MPPKVQRSHLRLRSMQGHLAKLKRNTKKRVLDNTIAVEEFTSRVASETKVRILAAGRRGLLFSGNTSRFRQKNKRQWFEVKTKLGSTCRRMIIPSRTTLRMAMDKLESGGIGLASLARSYSCSRQSVRRELMVAASFAFEADLKLLTNISAWLKERRPVLDLAVSLLCYDETSHKLRLPCTSKTFGKVDAQRAQTLEICVSEYVFHWIEKDVNRPYVFQFILPPEAIPSCSAQNLWNRFRRLKCLEPVVEFHHTLLERASNSGGLAVDIDSVDGASGNDLLHAALSTADPDYWTKQKVLCLSHRTMHTVVAVVAACFHMSIISQLYTMSNFLMMGTYLSRIINHLPRYLKNRSVVEIVEGTPPNSERAFAAEVIDYVSATLAGTLQEKESVRRRYRALFNIWGGGFYASNQFRIYTTEPITPALCDSLRSELASHLSSIAFSRGPTKPQLSKWTKLGMCLDWYVVALIGGYLPMLAHDALLTVAEHKDDADSIDEIKDASEAFLLDTSWRKIAAKGKTEFLKCLDDPDLRVLLVVMAVVLEPLRSLTLFYMSHSFQNYYKERIGFPDVCNMLNPATSLLEHCLQYYATMLSHPRKCGRLLLCAAQRGCRTFDEWHSAHSSDMATLRMSILCVVASLEQKQRQYLHKNFGILMLADQRLSHEQRCSIAFEIALRRNCCATPGLERSLKSIAALRAHRKTGAHCTFDTVAAELLEMGRVLFFIGHFIRLSIACVEKVHAMHKQLVCSGKTGLSTLRAMSQCIRSRHRHEQAREASSLAENNQHPRIGDAREASAQPRNPIDAFHKVLRALSPFEVFKKRQIAMDKSEGLHADPVASSSKERYRDLWSRVDIEEEVLCDEISDATKVIAERNRIASFERCASLAQGPVATPMPLADSLGDDIVPASFAPDRVEKKLALTSLFYDPGLFNPEMRQLVRGGKLGSVPSSDLPWSPSLLDSFKEGKGLFDGLPRRSKQKISTDWQANSKGELTANNEFPKNVAYSSQCGAICSCIGSAKHLQTATNLHKLLYKVVFQACPVAGKKRLPQCRLIGGVDCFLCLQCKDDQFTMFLRACVASGRSGRTNPMQMYTRLVCVEGEGRQPPFTSCVLQCARAAYVAPAEVPKSHLNVAVAGRIEIMSDIDVVAEMCSHGCDITISCLSCIPTDNFDRIDECRVTGITKCHELKHSSVPIPDAQKKLDAEKNLAEDDDIAGGLICADFTKPFSMNAQTVSHSSSFSSTYPGPSAFAEVAQQAGEEASDPEELEENGIDWLERELANITIDSTEDIVREIIADERSFNSFDDSSDAFECDPSVPSMPTSQRVSNTASSSSDSGQRPSSSASDLTSFAVGTTSTIVPMPCFDLPGLCIQFEFVDISTALVWRFADREHPSIVVLEVHNIGHPTGLAKLKATCRHRSHGRCDCWVSKCVEGPERDELLRKYMLWGSEGRVVNGLQHWHASQLLKRSYGMRVKV